MYVYILRKFKSSMYVTISYRRRIQNVMSEVV